MIDDQMECRFPPKFSWNYHLCRYQLPIWSLASVPVGILCLKCNMAIIVSVNNFVMASMKLSWSICVEHTLHTVTECWNDLFKWFLVRFYASRFTNVCSWEKQAASSVSSASFSYLTHTCLRDSFQESNLITKMSAPHRISKFVAPKAKPQWSQPKAPELSFRRETLSDPYHRALGLKQTASANSLLPFGWTISRTILIVGLNYA